MIEDLKPYPSYKNSDVPWLGQVPVHWDVSRLKNRVMNVIETTDQPALGDLCVALEHVESWTGKLRSAVPHKRFDSQVKRFRTGDVLLGKLRPYLAKVALPERNGVCVGEFFVLRPLEKSVSSRFLAYLMRTMPVIDIIDSSTFGARMPRAEWQFVGCLRLGFPPLAEQSSIVRFLDYADQRIQRYIRAKKKLITLLNEQKQAIIHRAVTRGLDQNVRLKPSGVEWLGDIPEAWSIERVKGVFRLRTQRSGRNHGLELLSVYTHIGVRPRRELEERGNRATTTDDYWLVKKGDLVVNKLLAWMGAVGVSQYEGVTSPAYDILMPIRELVPEFYHYLFRTTLYLQQFKQRSRGIMDMRLRLYFDQLGQIPVVVPPTCQQATIVDFVINGTAALDRAVETAQAEINLLREHRSRLISDVVTGKLDVREVAARLPDESEEPEVLDEGETMGEDDAGGEEGDLDAFTEEAI